LARRYIKLTKPEIKLWKEDLFMAGNESMTPVEEDISPYLRRPLRTLDRARQDRKRRLCRAAGEKTRTEQTASIPTFKA